MKIQGLKKYCDKEGHIVELIKNKKEIFKDIIGSNIKDIHSEVRFNKNKFRVDLVLVKPSYHQFHGCRY